MSRNTLPVILALAGLTLMAPLSQVAASQQAEVHARVVSGFTQAPLEAVTVEIVETGTSVETLADGRFRQSLEAGTYTLRVSRPNYVTIEEPIVLEAGQSLNVDLVMFAERPTVGEEVVVIGSRTERTVLETAVPVDVSTAASSSAPDSPRPAA